MRVLFTVVPERTSFLTMVPLAWALRTAGHEVGVASQPGFADTITQAGLTAVPVGRNADMYRLMAAAGLDLQTARPGLAPPYDVVENPEHATWDRILPAYTEAVAEEHRYENFPMIADLVHYARFWLPDLVVWEPSTFAGSIAAKACGAAHARLLGSIDVFGLTRATFLERAAEQPLENRADPLAEWLGSYGRRYGFSFSEDMTVGQFTIDQLPDSLRMPAPNVDYLPMQYLPYGGPAVIPKWLWTPPQRPRVGLTLGTTAAERFDSYTVDLAELITSLSDLDIELVATVGDSIRDRLGKVPDHTRIVPFVPLDALAETCTVVIDHAGSGTLLTVARHAVPQLMLPWDLDEPVLARRNTENGSALAIRGDLTTAPAVREAVLRLLGEPAFQERAAALRDEIRAMPTPNRLVSQLEELAAKHRATDQ